MATATFRRPAITEAELQRSCRMYRTTTLAARALSINVNTFTDLCRQHGIETPAERNRRATA